jgi:CheY-specific phosphatase CheX
MPVKHVVGNAAVDPLQGLKTDNIRKEILVVDSLEGELTAIFPRLRELTFNISHIRNPSWIPEIIEGSPSFALIAVSGPTATDAEAEAIMEAVTKRDNRVPVVWLDDATHKPPCFEGRSPDSILRTPCSPQALQANVYRLLKARFFPETVRKMFVDAAQKSMAECFRTHLNSVDSYLKADAMSLGPISATVSFVGDGCQGCVTISGTREFFLASQHRLLPNQPAPRATDIAGEACNVITGRFKSHLAKYGLSLRHSFPLLVEAHPLSLTYGGPGRMALVETLHDGDGECYLELCIDILDHTVLDKEPKTQSTNHQPGKLSFL